MYTRMVFGFEHTIRQVTDRWHAATPCGEWDVRQVTGHTIAVVSNVAARAGVGEPLDQFGDVSAIAGRDVATGLALPIDFEPDALAFVRAEYALRTEQTMRGPDLDGAEIAVDTDDDLTAILAFTGRRSGS